MKIVGRWIEDNPWKIIIFTLLVTVAFGFFIPQINMVTEFQKYLSPSNEAVKAAIVAERKYGSVSYLQVSIKPEGAIFDKDVLSRIKKLRDNIAALEGIKSGDGPLNSQVIVGEEKSIIVGPASAGGN